MHKSVWKSVHQNVNMGYLSVMISSDYFFTFSFMLFWIALIYFYIEKCFVFIEAIFF